MTQARTDIAGSSRTGSRKRSLRNLVFRLHTWLGLHASLILAILFVSGTMLVLSPELVVLHRVDLYTAPPAADAPHASSGALYDAAAAAVPGGTVTVIDPSPRPWFGAQVYVDDANGRPLIAHVRTTDASVIGTQPASPQLGFRALVRSLHDSFLGRVWPAHVFANLMSLVLLTMLATGLVTYRRFWKGFFRRPTAQMDARMRAGAWHRLAALWSLPFLFITALTSLIFLVHTIGVEPAQLQAAPAVAEREWRLPDGFTGDDLDRIVGVAEAALPGLEPKTIVLPFHPAMPFIVVGAEPGHLPFLADISAHVDPVTEEVIFVERPETGNLMASLYPVATALHFGHFWGLVGTALWLAFGILGSLLLLTAARLYAIRTIKERQGGAASGAMPTGTLRILWQGLGIWRWAYVLLALASIASVARLVL